jgi:hypothetical protein
MSVKIMGIVWEADLSQREKFVLLAYADHADHEGNNVYPSIGLIAWKTGYEPRSIQRITKKLIERGILIPAGTSQYHTNRYKIYIDAIPRLSPYIRGDSLSPARYGGDILSGVNEGEGGDKLAEGGDKMPPRGDIAMSPNPSFKPSFKPSVGGEEYIDTSAIFDVTAHTCEQLYQKVTGQISIPSNNYNRAQEDLSTILAHYKGDLEAAANEGKPIFQRWCATKGKSNRFYSRTNTAWLDWWLEKIAPSPGVDQTTIDTKTMTNKEFVAYLVQREKEYNDLHNPLPPE